MALSLLQTKTYCVFKELNRDLIASNGIFLLTSLRFSRFVLKMKRMDKYVNIITLSLLSFQISGQNGKTYYHDQNS